MILKVEVLGEDLQKEEMVLGVEGMIVIILAGSRDQFLEGVFAVLGNCELFQEANGGGLCLTDGQGGEEKKE